MSAPEPKPLKRSVITNTLPLGNVSTGIAYPGIADLFAMTSAELFEVLASPNKLPERIRSSAEPLSERSLVMLHRAQQVWPRALAVLGDDRAAMRWLCQTNQSLGGKAPLALMEDEAGYTLVMDTLGRIEFGIVS